MAGPNKFIGAGNLLNDARDPEEQEEAFQEAHPLRVVQERRPACPTRQPREGHARPFKGEASVCHAKAFDK